jgi:hypothetical protein
MTSNLSCEVLRDDIIALLYDDGEVAERSRARDHLALCVPCRLEYAELKGVRKALGDWSLPAVVSPPKARPAIHWFPTGLAAAAGLVLGIGVAMAGRSVFFPPTSGSASLAPAESAPAASARAQFVSHDELQQLLKSQEARHEAEIAELRRSLVSVPEPSSAQAGLQQNASNLSPATVERLLKASEDRQARLIEARLAGIRTESDLQRQYDMAQIAAGLAYIDSRTGADAARTSELMKNLVRVTAKPQDR